MLRKNFIVALVLIFLLPSLGLAKISCEKCEIGNCVCEITDCDSGIFDVFASTSCATEPDYEYIFSDGYLRWYPEIARSYYAKVLCSDGETQSDCFLITVKAKAATTTTTTGQVKPTTTTSFKPTTTLPEEEAEGPDYLLWVLIAVLIIVILFAIHYLLIKKGKSRKTYEELYKKWGKGR
jgi:hypothetical protein